MSLDPGPLKASRPYIYIYIDIYTYIHKGTPPNRPRSCSLEDLILEVSLMIYIHLLWFHNFSAPFPQDITDTWEFHVVFTTAGSAHGDESFAAADQTKGVADFPPGFVGTGELESWDWLQKTKKPTLDWRADPEKDEKNWYELAEIVGRSSRISRINEHGRKFGPSKEQLAGTTETIWFEKSPCQASVSNGWNVWPGMSWEMLGVSSAGEYDISWCYMLLHMLPILGGFLLIDELLDLGSQVKATPLLLGVNDPCHLCVFIPRHRGIHQVI